MAPSALLVDMDGTLVDSEELWHTAEKRLMNDLGSRWNPDDQAHCLGGPIERVIAYMIGKSGGTHDHDELKDRLLSYVNAEFMQHPLQFNQDMVRLVVSAHTMHIPSALVTASDHSLVTIVLAQLRGQLGFQPFSAVVAAGDADQGKPHPDPYLLAAEKLQVRVDQALAFEDSPTGVKAAVAAGCAVIALPLLTPITELGAANIKNLGQRSLGDLWSVACDNRAQNRHF
jgi:HAD superfamily hydrolase (TIGR01509 family)